MFKTAWLLEGVEFHDEGWTRYGLGPRTWLLMNPDVRGDYEERRDAVIAAGGALFDVSDARIALRTDGEALSKGCGLDFQRFPVGECRATLLARVPVLIARDEAGYVVFAPRSYAASLRAWLG